MKLKSEFMALMPPKVAQRHLTLGGDPELIEVTLDFRKGVLES